MLRQENWGIVKPLHGTEPDPGHPRAGEMRGAWLFNDYPVPFVEDVSGWNSMGEFGAPAADPAWAVGRSGGDWALVFDGNDEVGVGAPWAVSAFPDGITVVTWAYQAAWHNASYVYKDAVGALTAYELWGDAAGAVNFTIGAAVATSAAAVIPLNEWFQVAGTHDGAVTRVYLNGAEVGQQANVVGMIDNAFPLQFGLSVARPLTGLIDHVLLYGCPFDAEEVRELWEAPFAPFLLGYRMPVDEVVRPPGQSDTDWTMVRGAVKQ